MATRSANKKGFGGSAGGASSDIFVKVSGGDNTTNYLSLKISSGLGIATTILNPGGNEALEITTVPGGENAGGLDTEIQFNNANVLDGFDGMTIDNVTKVITMNAAGSATGDVIIKNSIGGTALFIDVSAVNVGIGTSNPNKIAQGGANFLTLESTGISIFEHASTQADVNGAFIAANRAWSDKVSGLSGRIVQQHFMLDGTTAGNRGGRYELLTKEDGTSNFITRLSINNAGLVSITGVVTLNPTFSTANDFEIKKSVSGTLLFADVSTGDIGIGTSNPNKIAQGGANFLTLESTGISIFEHASTQADVNGAFIGTNRVWSDKVSGLSGRIVQQHFMLDGAAVGNRGGRYELLTKEDGTSTFGTRLSINNAGLVTIHNKLAITENIVGPVLITTLSTGLDISTPAEGELPFRVANLIFSANVNLGYKIQMLNSGNAKIFVNQKEISEMNATTGAIVFNTGLLSTANFEIKKQTSGTTLFADVSTGFVGIGTAIPISALQVHSNTEPYIYITTATPAHRIIIGTDLIAGNTFGSSVIGDCVFRHDTGAMIFNARSASGSLIFSTVVDAIRMSIDSVGKIVMNNSFGGLADFEVKKQTSGTAFFVDVSSSFVGIGVASPIYALDLTSATEPRIHINTGTKNTFFGTDISAGDTSNVSLAGDSVYRHDNGNILITARTIGNGIRFATSNPDVIRMTIGDTGKVTINDTFTGTADFEVKAGISGISFKITASTALVNVAKGNLDISASGKGLGIKGGAVVDSIGEAVLVSGTVTVANTNILSTDKILIQRKTPGGTVGDITYTIINASSFTFTSDKIADSSTLVYFIIRTL